MVTHITTILLATELVCHRGYLSNFAGKRNIFLPDNFTISIVYSVEVDIMQALA